MARSIFFCYGCNERFEARGDADARCPLCGERLDDMVTVPTASVEAAGDREPLSKNAEASTDALIGSTLASYRVDGYLGSGGMARVYRAFHPRLERPCALKILSPELAVRSPGLIDAFLAEARAAASLVHPNVVTVHNVGEEKGVHFIELELVPGRSLHRLVVEDGPLPPGRAAALLGQAVQGLAEAHRHGLVHRDLKPANVLLQERRPAKLADFGLAKRVVTGRPGFAELSGTPHFMAPELFDGREAGRESDVYASGVSLFFLVTGKLPFTAPTLPEVVQKHRSEPIPDPRALRPDLPGALHDVIERCLAKDPEARYRDGAELEAALTELAGSLRELESIVRAALRGEVSWRPVASGRFEAHVRLEKGRRQRVTIERAESAFSDGPLVRISSPCAPVRKSYLYRALELNAEIPHGAISIEPRGGVPHFVVTDAYPYATCDPEEVRASVLTIARWADEIEAALTGDDRH